MWITYLELCFVIWTENIQWHGTFRDIALDERGNRVKSFLISLQKYAVGSRENFTKETMMST